MDVLPKLVWHFDEPYADSSALPTYYVSKMTRQYVTVALNGDGGDEVVRGFVGHAVQSGQLVGVEVIQVGEMPDELFFEQLIDKFFAEAVDVQGGPLGKVDYIALHLRGTSDVLAAGHYLSLGENHPRVAHGALLRHLRRFLPAGTLGSNHPDDLWDDVPGALHDDRVADARIETANLVLIVQRGARHGHPADTDGLEHGHRRKGAGPADLPDHVLEFRGALVCGEFVSQDVARTARTHPEALLQDE